MFHRAIHFVIVHCRGYVQAADRCKDQIANTLIICKRQEDPFSLWETETLVIDYCGPCFSPAVSLA